MLACLPFFFSPNQKETNITCYEIFFKEDLFSENFLNSPGNCD